MRQALLTLMSLLLFSCSAGMRSYDVTHLVKNGQLKLIDGTQVSVAKTKRVVFTDPKPGANWGHTAFVTTYDSQSQETSRQEVDLPPVGLSQDDSDDPFAGLFDEVKKVRPTLKAKPKLRVTEPKHYYALLINGQANSQQGEPRQWNDFAFLYQTLTKVYGYNPKNIFVANSTDKEGENDLDGDSKPDIRFGSTKEDIQTLFATLKTTLKKSDRLLIAVNDHAIRREGKTFLLLDGSRVEAKEFADWVTALPTDHVLSLHQQCFGGAFVRPLADKNRIAISASMDRELSWATPDLSYNELFYWMTSAFAMQTPKGEDVKSDLNGDGRVTVTEAFSFAMGKNRRPESSLLEAGPSRMTAKNRGLGD